MSRFKYVCEYKNEGKICNVYKDKLTNTYYKIEDGVAKRIFSDDVKIADKLVNCKRKHKLTKKEFALLSYAAVVSSLIFIEVLGVLNLKTTIVDKKEEVKTETILDDSLIDGSKKYYLTEALKHNKTIKDDLLLDYVDVISALKTNDNDFVIITSKFKNYNFKKSEITVENLNEIFNLNDYGFVASELYNYVHKSKNDQNFSVISNIFAGERDVLERLFAGESLDDLISEKVGTRVCIDDILENKAVKKYIGKKKEKYDYFPGELQNNVFNTFICINHDDEFNFYIKEENGSLINVTYEYYEFELMRQIFESDKLDYKNESDRKLVYFYATANLNGVFLDDPVEEILTGAFLSATDGPYLSAPDLYAYLSNYEFNYKKLMNLSDLVYYSGSLPLLQEVNLCLKEEVKAGNLNEIYYLKFIDIVTHYLKETDELDFESFSLANKYDEPIDGFKLDLKKGCNL